MGTIAGNVRGPDGSAPFSGRTVEVTNDATVEKRTLETADNGGFSIMLPAGKYRVDLRLLPGEIITKRPGTVVLDRGDIDSHVEFLLSPSRVNRSKGPAYRVDNGLGSPVA